MGAIVFDLDGTLVDSAPDLLVASNKLLADHGAELIDLDQLRSFVGNGVPKLVERLAHVRGLEPSGPAFDRLVADFINHYNAGLYDRSRLYPGVKAALLALKAQGHVLGICTNKPFEQAEKIVHGLGLSSLMDVLIGGDSLAVKKPSPEPLIECFSRLNMVGMHDCLYVGDSEVDWETAQAAEVPFALYTQGYRKTPLEDMNCPVIFSHFDAFAELVAQARIA